MDNWKPESFSLFIVTTVDSSPHIKRNFGDKAETCIPEKLALHIRDESDATLETIENLEKLMGKWIFQNFL